MDTGGIRKSHTPNTVDILHVRILKPKHVTNPKPIPTNFLYAPSGEIDTLSLVVNGNQKGRLAGGEVEA